MSSDERRPQDAQWIERVREGWQASAQTPNQRAAFDDRLEDRLQQRSRVSWLRPVGVLATSAVVTALVWNATLPAAESVLGISQVAEADSQQAMSAEVADAWIEFGDEIYAVDLPEWVDASLPDDYAAMESLLFGS